MLKGFWGGRFFKHRLGTGDVSNHLEVVSIERIDETDDELVALGDGEFLFLVTVQFTDGDKSYEFEFESDSPEGPSEEEVIHEVAHYFEP